MYFSSAFLLCPCFSASPMPCTSACGADIADNMPPPTILRRYRNTMASLTLSYSPCNPNAIGASLYAAQSPIAALRLGHSIAAGTMLSSPRSGLRYQVSIKSLRGLFALRYCPKTEIVDSESTACMVSVRSEELSFTLAVCLSLAQRWWPYIFSTSSPCFPPFPSSIRSILQPLLRHSKGTS
jgi:hypothetical protein